MKTKSLVILAPLLGYPAGAACEAVPWGYQKVAEAFDIPTAILYAIALTESGLKLPGGAVRPWPWTLNVEGRPERFASRRQAYAALIRYLERGITLIDVGLMQVNWRYHHARLGSPWAALEPYHNIRVGSRILREEYRHARDWREAVGRYHSPGNPARAAHYRRRVEKHVRKLSGRSL